MAAAIGDRMDHSDGLPILPSGYEVSLRCGIPAILLAVKLEINMQPPKSIGWTGLNPGDWQEVHDAKQASGGSL